MSGPAAKLTGSIFDPQQPFGPPSSSSASSSSSSWGADYNNASGGNDDDDDDLASLRPFVMDTAQAQGLGPGSSDGDGEPGMGSYTTSSSSMLPDIEMTTPLPVAVAAYNDNGDAAINTNGGYVGGDGSDYDMTAAFLSYKPNTSSQAATTPPPMSTVPISTSPAISTTAISNPATTTATEAAIGTGTVLSAKVTLGSLTSPCYI